MSESRVITIFNLRLAGYLMLKGFPLINTISHRDNHLRKICIFPRSEALRGEIDKFCSNKEYYTNI